MVDPDLDLMPSCRYPPLKGGSGGGFDMFLRCFFWRDLFSVVFNNTCNSLRYVFKTKMAQGLIRSFDLFFV